MQEAYFENIRSRILPLLRSSLKEVKIAMAWFTSIELFGELINCLKRGVRVEIVLLDHPINFMEYAPDFNEFINAGGTLHVALSEHGLMHHKFCVIDKAMVITGSYNWTYYAETRNIENILITDNPDIVGKYLEEFIRLTQKIQGAEAVPRYTLDQLESMQNVDIADINYETEQISRIFHKPVRPVVNATTHVIVTEIAQHPISAYGIGIWKKGEDNSDRIETIIPKGEKLPYTSKEHILFYDSDLNDSLVTHIVGEKSENDGILIWEGEFDEIVGGIIKDDLSLKYRISLDVNGDLKMIVSCLESGKRKTITVLKQKLVKYE